jgi:molybdopterin molybdotransferase
VHLPTGLTAGTNRRRAGEDVAPGDRLLAQGRVLRPQDLGLAVQLGHATLPVVRRLKVALFSSGDELVEPGETLAAGRIPDANRPILRALLQRTGFAVDDLGILPDDADGVARRLTEAARSHHAIVVSGGAAGGDEDHIARCLARHGSVDVWRLAMKPGRPFLIGRLQRATVLGLPGNPVAATVACVRLARPLLLRLQGAPWQEPQALPLPAAFALAKPLGRTEYLRGRLVEGPAVALIDKPGSNRVTSLAEADGLIELGPDVAAVEHGDTVAWLPLALLGLD